MSSRWAVVEAGDRATVVLHVGGLRSATEGAALKMPEKLFGRKMSPSTANAETTAPPTRKRRTSSLSTPATRYCILRI